MTARAQLATFLQVLGSSPALGRDAQARLYRELHIQPTLGTPVHEERQFTLLHFPAAGPPAGHEPVLLVPSLINRWYVLDLLAGHSLVEALTQAGLSIYVMVWKDPHEGQGAPGLPELIARHLHRAVQRTARHAGTARVALLGQCLGGTLALVYAVCFPAHVARLVTLTTPVDFSAPGLLATWTTTAAPDLGPLLRAFPGVVPDTLVYGAFPLLDPRALITRTRTLWEGCSQAEFVRLYQALDLWTTDHLPVTSGVLRSLVEDLYQHNLLWRGEWRVAGQTVRLEDLQVPLLNVVAQRDDIVPPASARPLTTRVRAPVVEEFVSPAGHVTSILASPRRVQTYAAITEFLCRDLTA